MPAYLDKIKQSLGFFGKGLMLEMAPGIAGGIINEMFHQWNVDVAKITQYVQSNQPLLDGTNSEQIKQLKGLPQGVDNLDFLTPDLVINSIKKDFPAVASLFLNWPEANEWLTRQIDDIKKQAVSGAP